MKYSAINQNKLKKKGKKEKKTRRKLKKKLQQIITLNYMNSESDYGLFAQILTLITRYCLFVIRI